MKEFKVGKYHIFDRDIKKIGKATIHGFVELNGTKHAVVSYRDNDNVPYIKDLPMCELDGRTAIFLLDAGFIYADAPVQPNAAKFQVGKTYIDDKHVLFDVTNKYIDAKGITHIILNNKYVADIAKTEVDGNIIKYTNFFDWDADIRRKFYATNSLGDLGMKRISAEAKTEFLNKADDAIRQCCLAMNRAFGDLIIKTFEITDPEDIAKVKAYVDGKVETSTAHMKELIIGPENDYDEMPEDVISFLDE